MLAGAWSCGGSDKPPAKGPGECVEMGAKTGVAGAKTGVTTGVAGVKQFGQAVGGLVESGSEGAEREWNEGKADTKRTAKEGSKETKQEAKPCK